MALTSDDVSGFLRRWVWPAVAALALIASLALLVGHFRAALQGMFGISGAHGQSVIFSSILGTCALVALCLGAILLGVYSPEAGSAPTVWRVSRNMLATIVGALLGWAVAVMYTPFGDADAARLHSLGQAVTVFASGYLISKVDRFLEKSLFGADGTPGYAWVPMGLAVCAFLATSVMTFEARQYASDPDGVAIRFTAAPNVRLQAGDAKLQTDGTGRLSVAGRNYGPVPAGALVKFVIATQDVYVNGEPIEALPAAVPPPGGAAAPAPSPSAAHGRSGAGQ